MTNHDTKMVGRSVYLPPDVDNQIRVRAFHEKKTTNELIREAVVYWLLNGPTETGPTLHVAGKLDPPVTKDELGDRMKAYEAVYTDVRLPENQPVYARIDGRSFSELRLL